jgi:hypothetical protein
MLGLLAGFGLAPLHAGFRSPESLVRNVYAYYGDRSSELSSGLPRDADTARQFLSLRWDCSNRSAAQATNSPWIGKPRLRF